MRLIFIYRWLELLWRDFSACTRKSASLSLSLPFFLFRFSLAFVLFQPFVSPRQSRDVASRSLLEPAAKRSRTGSLEEVGVGARAEVTAAPERSRGRAPERSDASIATCTTVSSSCHLPRSLLSPSHRPFCLLTCNRVFFALERYHRFGK